MALRPYGWSKLMTERILDDVARSYPFNYCALRYFNVAGADPKGRAGPSTPAPLTWSRSL
jgi:UDP-glucose 4-epimerase